MKEYKFKINGKDYDVVINSVEGKNADVTVNGASYQVELENAPAAVPAAAPAAAPVADAAPKAAPAAAPAAKGAGTKVPSPMQGTVVDIKVKEGDAVKSGQTVVVLESMKMEVEISATADGTVSGILVAKGDRVDEGQPVVSIA